MVTAPTDVQMDERKADRRVTVRTISVIVIAIGAIGRAVMNYRATIVVTAIVTAVVPTLVNLLNL